MTININSFKDNFRLYNRPLCLFALHYLHDIDNAEDTVQDCFAELWERKDSGMEISEIKSYLYSMVRNRCIDIVKKDSLIDSNVSRPTLKALFPKKNARNVRTTKPEYGLQ